MSKILEGEELLCSLRQLVVSFAPHIKEAGSVENAIDNLVHLEEYDANFHRYEFVKRLRTTIESKLSRLTDEEIEGHRIHPNDSAAGNERLMGSIINRVMRSDEYNSLMCTLKKSICGASESLLYNFDREFASFSSDCGTGGRSLRGGGATDVLLYSDEESSLGDSSLNQSGYMFLNTEQFQSIAESMDKKRSIETRRDALNSVSRIATVDVVNCEVWPVIRQAIQDALIDPDAMLSMQALRFLAKGLSSNDSCIKEMFTTLAEFLSIRFQCVGQSQVPKMKHGLDCSKTENVKLLKAFRLANEFQQRIPQYWVRYPERFLEDVLEVSISLLAIQPTTASGATALVTPSYFLALIDPKANWFTKWMHGHYSRAPLLKAIEKQRNIVDNAVRACVEYAMAEKTLPAVRSSGETICLHYTEQELQYMYVVHSLHFIGRLLLNKHGRSFFPVKTKDIGEPLTITKFLVCLLRLITRPAMQTSSVPAHLDPALITLYIVRKLCCSEISCQQCICYDHFTNALLSPVVSWLDGSMEERETCGTTLYLIAEILSNIAASSRGRQHLLYGETGVRFARTSSSAAHVIAEFTTKALAGKLPPECGRAPSCTVIGSFIFVCRQLYNTCEGLLSLRSYQLHESISQAWLIASREADQAATPTPSMDSDGNDVPTRESQYILLWEETLRDSLLNLSATPKGVLLLQQSGAITECVSYLYSRHTSKLQLSKFEKFGYGYMISLLTATVPGICNLIQTGYIEDVIKTLWGELEVADDLPVITPRSWPVNPIDKLVKKPFNNLVKILSSFSAVYELLYGVELPTKPSYSVRETPSTIEGVIDRLVMVDRPEKISALFNYEQSHTFGLRLLSVLISCLDTQLLLQTQYNFQEMLLKCQKENTTDNKTVIIDMLSLERNYLLVKSYLIGGATERRLPPRSLPSEKDSNFAFPLFTSYPVPKEYSCIIGGKSAMKKENDLSRYLSESRKCAANLSWLEKCRKAFCSLLTTKPELASANVLQDLLDKSVEANVHIKEGVIFPSVESNVSDSTLKKTQLSTVQELGLKLTLRYGSHLKLIANNAETSEKLSHLLKQCASFCEQQQRAAPHSRFRCLATSSHGYDWFVATLFLMMSGNHQKTWRLLQKLSLLTSSAYLWPARLHRSVHLPDNLMLSGIPVILSNACHSIDLVLQTEVAHVYSAFRMAGYPPAQICQHWIRQCFWNYLDWLDITHYVCVCIVLGVDYQVYMCVAVLRYLHHDIMRHMQEKDLVAFLKEEPIHGFHVGEHLEYMQQLEKKFRRTILPDMQNIAEP